MKISRDTKISAIIKFNSDAIEAIVSINNHFTKLRNPIYRKLLAARVTIADAAKLGGTEVQTIYDKLIPLGFSVEKAPAIFEPEEKGVPYFMKHLTPAFTEELDVRAGLANGVDPFNLIMDTLNKMPKEKTLKLINTFEPAPLITILHQKGYIHYTVRKEPQLIFTYLKYVGESAINDTFEQILPTFNDIPEFEAQIKCFGDKIVVLDVRYLDMPKPILFILKELAILPADSMLYVHHKKVPHFLFPEIQERGFRWLINELDENDVKLLIYK